ncbi:MAG: class I SAM-dependent methyltransferase [Flavobacteriaceae bacterium]|nr:class I SAM-dependent methyltransferase [Flavobacteriaceae bacterium]
MDYNTKKKDYYQNVRLDLLSLLDFNKKYKVLEVGAGLGATLSFLKEEQIATEAVGIDIVDGERKPNIDTFILKEIEKVDLSAYNEYFDLIIFADVLEHLIDPLRTLQDIKKALKKNGVVLISIPNIRNIRALYKVFIKGDFSYEERGVFDYTHLRFFCKKNIKELVVNSGLQVDIITSSFKKKKEKRITRFINTITFHLFEEFFTVQYLVKATA